MSVLSRLVIFVCLLDCMHVNLRDCRECFEKSDLIHADSELSWSALLAWLWLDIVPTSSAWFEKSFCFIAMAQLGTLHWHDMLLRIIFADLGNGEMDGDVDETVGLGTGWTAGGACSGL